MKLSLVQVPYHYGFAARHIGAGRGPGRYLEAGAAEALRKGGFEVGVEEVTRQQPTKEIPATVAEGNAILADVVARAVASGAFPLVLSGGCNACLGVLAGLNSKVGIVWFDAHGDFNTPETTPSGFFDGMPLAVATGLCYRDLWSRIATMPPVSPADALLVAVRDLDPGERENIRQSGLLAVGSAEIKTLGVPAALEPKLELLRARLSDIYLHFDIDALDPEVVPGVDYRAPGGLTIEEAEAAIRLIARTFRVRAAALTAYNPDRDPSDKSLQAGLQVLAALADAARRSQSRNP